MGMMALGQVSTLAQARLVVYHSFILSRFEPPSRAGWDQVYACLLVIMQQQG